MTKLPPLFSLSILILSDPFKKIDDTIQLNEYIENVACLSDYSNMFELLGCKLSSMQLQTLESRVETMIDIVTYSLNNNDDGYEDGEQGNSSYRGLMTEDEYLELERKEKALIALQCEVTQARNDLEYVQTQKFIYA